VAEATPSHARVLVTNDGPGIPVENVEQIFQPFFTTKEVGAGTGLSLSVFRSLGRTGGGKLTATPGRKSGAQLVLRLPRAKLS
jgi:C4-dicarboxylate-specific signal transduction histidine kinase